jgi:ribosomal protein L11 methyltransferase
VDWQTLELDVPAAQLARAEALLSLLGAASVPLAAGDGSEILEPEPGTTPVWAVTTIRAAFPASTDIERVAALLSQGLDDAVEISIAASTDEIWTDALTPQPSEIGIGSRLTICGAQHAPPIGNRTVVRLNRGLGFGTGDHPTTRLCLEWLDASLAAHARVIDYGCGSGILAVTALRLGAAFAWAVDIEPQALEATAANAELNGVGERLWIGHPDDLRTRDTDVVLANILATPLIALAPRLASLVSRRGTVVLTGLLPEQAGAVRNAYAAHFAALSRRDRDGWTCLVASDRRA